MLRAECTELGGLGGGCGNPVSLLMLLLDKLKTGCGQEAFQNPPGTGSEAALVGDRGKRWYCCKV